MADTTDKPLFFDHPDLEDKKIAVEEEEQVMNNSPAYDSDDLEITGSNITGEFPEVELVEIDSTPTNTSRSEFEDFADQFKKIFPSVTTRTLKSLYSSFHTCSDFHEKAANYYMNENFHEKDKKVSPYFQDDSSRRHTQKANTAIRSGRTMDDFYRSSAKHGVDGEHDDDKSSKKYKQYTSDYRRSRSSTGSFKEEYTENGLVRDRSTHYKTWSRYIGSMNVSCWCTRTVFGSSIKEGDSIRLSEGSVLNSSASLAKDKSKNHSPPDASVYIFTQHDRLMGKVSAEYATIICPLLTDKSVAFDAHVVSCKKSRLSLGDGFVIQVDCFLNSAVFVDAQDGAQASLEDFLAQYKKSGQSDIEGAFQKQVNFDKLFKEINFLSEIQKLDKKILKQKMRIERELKNKNKDITTIDLSDEIVKEHNKNAAEGDLSLNQLRDLYNSAQSNSLDTQLPETTPSNVKLDLRPYQKQGLSWMLDRESKFDLIENGKSVDSTIGGEQQNPLWREYQWPKGRPLRAFRIDQMSGERKPICSESDRGYDFEDEDFEEEILKNPECTPQTKFYYNFFTGSFTFKKPFISFARKGGILADEMGLGKTISALSLILTAPEDLTGKDRMRAEHYAYRTTLIVVPMALLSQWESEFNKANKDPKNKCFVYYGQSSPTNLSTILLRNDAPIVVITTYGTIQAEHARISKGGEITDPIGLFSVKYHRIILDEGHTIRNKSTKTAKVLATLQSRNRWILTGTPIINRLDDLYSLIKFLDIEPWRNYPLWKFYISKPFESGSDVTQAFSLLKTILTPIFLRRTKDQRDKEGKLLVELLPKEVVFEKLKFNEKEEAIYNWLLSRAYSSFKENMRSDGGLTSSYTSILTQILRLRQVCCHVDLVKRVDNQLAEEENLSNGQLQLEGEAVNEITNILNMIEEKEVSQRFTPEKSLQLKEEIYETYPNFDNIECSICTSDIEIETCVITECKHCFCLSCLIEHFNYQDSHNYTKPEDEEGSLSQSIPTLEKAKVLCPLCRGEIKKNRLFRTFLSQFKNKQKDLNGSFDSASFLTQAEPNGSPQDRKYYVRPFNPYGKSSKINALLSHLHQINDEEPGDRVIVFSQFTSFLDLVEQELLKYSNEFSLLRFDGKMNATQRAAVLNEFTKGEGPKNKLQILLISLKAGGVGLNLTVASKAFLLDPHWNSANENQAIDRIHRIGQIRNVKVIRFIMENSIEEKMLKIQERKDHLGDALTMTDDERRKQRIEEIKILFSK